MNRLPTYLTSTSIQKVDRTVYKFRGYACATRQTWPHVVQWHSVVSMIPLIARHLLANLQVQGQILTVDAIRMIATAKIDESRVKRAMTREGARSTIHMPAQCSAGTARTIERAVDLPLRKPSTGSRSMTKTQMMTAMMKARVPGTEVARSSGRDHHGGTAGEDMLKRARSPILVMSKAVGVSVRAATAAVAAVVVKIAMKGTLLKLSLEGLWAEGTDVYDDRMMNFDEP